MITDYDIIAELMKSKNPKAKDIVKSLGHEYSAVHKKLIGLLKNDIIKKGKPDSFPISTCSKSAEKSRANEWNNVDKERKYYFLNLKNRNTQLLVRIIHYCLNENLNYNYFLTEIMSKILEICLSKETVSIKDFEGFNKTTLKKYVDRLIQYNFIIIKSRKPFVFSILRADLFKDVVHFFGGNIEEPSYEFDEKIFEEIKRELERFKRKEKKQNKLYIESIENGLKFDFIHSTTYLEGNTLTLEETIKLLDHKLYPKKDFDDILEVKNMKMAVDYLFENLEKPMDLNWMLEVHRIIMQGLHEWNGRIRTGQVAIMGNPNFKICHYSILEPTLNEFFSNFEKRIKECETIKDKILFCAWVHNEFQYIHPFFDGNSRTTRLVMNYCFLKFGFPMINIYDTSKDEYLSLTKLSADRDDKKFVIFLSKIVLDNLIKLNEMIERMS